MKNFGISKKHILALAVTAAVVGGLAVAQSRAAVTYTLIPTSSPDNWSTITEWSPNSPTGGAQGAGNIAQYNTASTAATTALDAAGIVIGQVQNINTGDWTITDGGNSITLNNTGGSTNALGDANAFIGATNSGNLTFIPNISINTTNLDIGTTGTGAVTIGTLGTNTITSATAARILTLKANGAGNITINSNLALTGTAFAIVNSGSSSGAVTIAGNIGGATTTVTQNSATSSLTLSGTDTGLGGNTTLTLGTLFATNNSVFGTGKLILNGGTLSTSSASGALTFANALQFGTGTGATSTITGSNAVTFNGGYTAPNNGDQVVTNNTSLLTIAGTATDNGSYLLTFNGTGNTTISATIGGGPGHGITDGITGGGVLTFSGSSTFTGGVVVNAGSILALGSSSNLATPVTSGPVGKSTLTLNPSSSAVTPTIIEAVTSAQTIYNAITLQSGTVSSGQFAIGGSFDLTFGGSVLQNNGNGSTIAISHIGMTTFSGGYANTGAGTVVNGAGNVTFNSVISGPKNFTYSGTGILTLSGANTDSGTVTISSGTLAIGSDSVGSPITSGPLGTIGATFTGGTTSGSPLTIEAVGGVHTVNNAITLNGTSAPFYQIAGSLDLTFGGLMTNSGNNSPVFAITNSGATTFSGGISLTNSATNHTMTFNGSGNVNINSVISQSTSTGSGVVYSGTGTLTLTGANTYGGATTINSGTVKLNLTSGSVLAGTAVAVGSAATNATLQVIGNNTMGSLTAGSITLSGGDGVTTGQGILTLVDSAINSLTITNRTTAANNFTVGGATAGAASILDFEIGASSGSNDSIALGTGKLVVNAGGGIVNLTALSAFAPGNYNLLTYGAKSGTGIFTFDGTNTTETIGIETLTLTTGGTSTVLSITQASPPEAYFQGSVDTNWSTSSGGNFTSDSAGTSPLTSLPGSQSNVHFYAGGATLTGGTVVSNVDANFTVNSLMFDSNSAPVNLTASGGSVVTINAGTFGSNTAPNGIFVGSSAGAVNISAAIALGGPQTWTNSSANALIVSGVVSGGNALTTVGNIQLGGVNTFSGGITITSGTLQMNGNSTSAGNGGLGSINNAATINGTLDLNATNQGVGSLSGSGIILNSGAGLVTLTIGNGNATGASFSGTIEDNGGSGGTIALTKTGTGTQTLTGTNNYSGGITLSGGGLIGTTASLLGNIAASSSTAITFSQTGVATYSGNITGGNSAALTVTGGVSLALTGTNSYTGGTTVAASTTLTAATTGIGTGAVADAGSVIISNSTLGSFAGAISGVGSLSLGGPVSLTGKLSNTGGVSVTGGTVTFGGATANVFNSAESINITGGTLFLNKTGGTNAINAGTVNIALGATLQYAPATTETTETNRVVNVVNNGTIDVNGGFADMDSVTGSGLVTDTSATAGTFNILHGGNNATHVNVNFGGTIQDGSGMLNVVDNDNATLIGASTYTGTTTAQFNTLTAGVASVAGVSGAFGNNSPLIFNAGSVNLANFNTQVGSLTSLSTGNIALGSATLTTAGGTGNPTYATTTFSGNITSATGGGFTKGGAYTQILSGTGNTYNGPTLISGGTVTLSGAGSINSSSNITINGADARLINNSSVAITAPVTISQGTIGGSGTISAAGGISIGNNAIVSPGNSPADQAYTTGMTFASGGTYKVEINLAGSPAAGTNNDELTVSGGSGLNITATSGSPFNLDVTSLAPGNTAGDVADFDNTQSYSWEIATTSGISGYDPGEFNISNANFSNSLGGGTFGTNVVGNDLFLTFTPTGVPEPTSLALLGLGAAMLLRRRRRSSFSY